MSRMTSSPASRALAIEPLQRADAAPAMPLVERGLRLDQADRADSRLEHDVGEPVQPVGAIAQPQASSRLGRRVEPEDQRSLGSPDGREPGGEGVSGMPHSRTPVGRHRPRPGQPTAAVRARYPSARGPGELGPRLRFAAELAQQVAADARQQVVTPQTQARPRAGRQGRVRPAGRRPWRSLPRDSARRPATASPRPAPRTARRSAAQSVSSALNALA